MTSVPSVETLLWFVAVACHGILLVRMRIAGLHVIYRCFFIYLIVHLGRSLVLANLNRRSNVYGWTYVASEPVIWCLYVLVVLELFGLVLRDYPGIQTLSRRLLAGALAVSAVVAMVTLIPDLGNPAERYPILRAMFVAQRLVMSTLVVFLAILTAFLVWYPVPLCRNVVVYCAGYSVYFISATMALFVRTISGEVVTRMISVVLHGVGAACAIAWVLLLNAQGERKRSNVRRHIPAIDEDRLVSQLDAINRSLLRSARK